MTSLSSSTTARRSRCSILAAPKTTTKRHVSDPLEPDYGGGKNKAIIYTDGRPHIHSLAHGGIEYRLEPDPRPSFRRYSQMRRTRPDGPNRSTSSETETRARSWTCRPAPCLTSSIGTARCGRTDGGARRFCRLGRHSHRISRDRRQTSHSTQDRDTGWKVPAFLWGLLVEDPGGKKSPVMSAVTTPLQQLDTR